MAAITTSSVRTSITTSRTTSTVHASRTTTTAHTPSAPGPVRNVRTIKPVRRGYGLFYSDDEDDGPSDMGVQQSRPVPATTSKLDSNDTVKRPDFAFKSNRKVVFTPDFSKGDNNRESDDEQDRVSASSDKAVDDDRASKKRSQQPSFETRERATRKAQQSSKRGQSSRQNPYERGGIEGKPVRRKGFGLFDDLDDDSIELEEKFNNQYAMASAESTPVTPRNEFKNKTVVADRPPHTPQNPIASRGIQHHSSSSSPDLTYNSRSPDGHSTPGGKTSWGQWIKKLIPGSVKKSALSRSAELLEDVDRTINVSENLAQSVGSTTSREYPNEEEEQSFLLPGAFDGLFEDDANKANTNGSKHNYANSLLFKEVYNSRVIKPEAKPWTTSNDLGTSRARYTARPSRRVSTSFTGHDRSIPSTNRPRISRTRVPSPVKPSTSGVTTTSMSTKRVRRTYVVDAMSEAERERDQIQKLAEIEQIHRDSKVKFFESLYEARKIRSSLGLEEPENEDLTLEAEKTDEDNVVERGQTPPADNKKKRKADQQTKEDDLMETVNGVDVTKQSGANNKSDKSGATKGFITDTKDNLPKLPATPTLSHAQLPAPIAPAPTSSEPATSSSAPNRGSISPQKSLGYARSQAEKFKPIKSSGLRSSTTMSSTVLPETVSDTFSLSPATHSLFSNDGSPNNGKNFELANESRVNGEISVKKHIGLIHENKLELFKISPLKPPNAGSPVRESIEEVWETPISKDMQDLFEIFSDAVKPIKF